MYNLIRCPACNASHYQYHYSTTTAMGWVQEYKDGVPLNSNPNITTGYYTCCECNHRFSVREQYGEIIEIVDEGEKVKTTTIEAPSLTLDDITASSENTSIYRGEEPKTQVTLLTQPDIEQLHNDMQEILTELRCLYNVLAAKT